LVFACITEVTITVRQKERNVNIMAEVLTCLSKDFRGWGEVVRFLFRYEKRYFEGRWWLGEGKRQKWS